MTLSASQIAIRSSGIGSSEIAAICGISFWKRAADGSQAGGPHSVFEAKFGLSSSEGSLASRAGDRAEKLAEYTYEHELGIKLAPLLDASGDPITMRHPDHQWVLASIDRVRVDNWIPVEIKAMFGLRSHYHEGSNPYACAVCGREKFLHWQDPNVNPSGIPDDVMCQVQWQLFVCGAPYAEVARFWIEWDGLQFARYIVPSNAQWQNHLYEVGHEFWHKHILLGIPPDPDASKESERCERHFAQKVLRKLVPAPPGTEQHVRDFLEAESMIKTGEKQKLQAANWLRRISGDAEGMVGDDYVVTNKPRVDGTRVLKVKKT